MSVFRDFWNNVVGTAEGAVKTVEDTASAAVDEVKQVVSTTAATVEQDPSAVTVGMIPSGSVASNSATEAAAASDWVTDAASSVYETVSDTVSEVEEGVENAAASVVDAVEDTVTSVVDGVEDAASSLYDTASETVSNAVDAVEDTATAAVESVVGGSRGLTPSERGNAQSVYQDSIDYDAVVITRGGLGAVGAPARTIGNTICMGDEQFDGNTMNLTAEGMVTLMHEMAHVWQYQHGGAGYIPSALGSQLIAWATTGDRDNAYIWQNAVNEHVPWENWNAEQQAEAMEDYYKAKKRIGTPDERPNDQRTVAVLAPYVEKVRAGQGAPGLPDVRTGPTPLDE